MEISITLYYVQTWISVQEGLNNEEKYCYVKDQKNGLEKGTSNQ